MATEIPPGNQTRDIERDISSAREGLRDMIGRGSEKAGRYKDIAMERGKNAVTAMRGQVEARPLMILGGVFVAGLAVGMLMRGRRRYD